MALRHGRRSCTLTQATETWYSGWSKGNGIVRARARAKEEGGGVALGTGVGLYICNHVPLA